MAPQKRKEKKKGCISLSGSRSEAAASAAMDDLDFDAVEKLLDSVPPAACF